MSVEVIFRKGFGNNLFQYVFGRLLSEHHNVPFIHDKIYNHEQQKNTMQSTDRILIKTDWNRSDEKTKQFYKTLFFQSKHYILKDYFEDYTLYLPHEQKIKSWFPKIDITNTQDLVVHFRAGDALLYKGNITNFPSVAEWKTVIGSITYNKLYVVTDSEDHIPVTEMQVNKRIKEIMKKRNYTTRQKFTSDEEGASLMNRYINLFNEYRCVWIHNDNFMDDFNYLRKFDKILIGPSTFSWWAAFLSDAKDKYVYKAWRKGKKERNKNLGQIPWKHW